MKQTYPYLPKLLPWLVHQWWMNTTTPMLIGLATVQVYRDTLDMYWPKEIPQRPYLYVVEGGHG